MKRFVITKMPVSSELQWGHSRKLKETEAGGSRDGGRETEEAEGSEEEEGEEEEGEEVGETITG